MGWVTGKVWPAGLTEAIGEQGQLRRVASRRPMGSVEPNAASRQGAGTQGEAYAHRLVGELRRAVTTVS